MFLQFVYKNIYTITHEKKNPYHRYIHWPLAAANPRGFLVEYDSLHSGLRNRCYRGRNVDLWRLHKLWLTVWSGRAWHVRSAACRSCPQIYRTPPPPRRGRGRTGWRMAVAVCLVRPVRAVPGARVRGQRQRSREATSRAGNSPAPPSTSPGRTRPCVVSREPGPARRTRNPACPKSDRDRAFARLPEPRHARASSHVVTDSGGPASRRATAAFSSLPPWLFAALL